MNSIFWCFRLIVLGYFSFHFLCRYHDTGDDLFVVPHQKAIAASSMVRSYHAHEPKNAEIAAYGWPCPGYVVASISMLMANPRGTPSSSNFHSLLLCLMFSCATPSGLFQFILPRLQRNSPSCFVWQHCWVRRRQRR